MYEDVYGDGGYAGEHNDGELDGGKHDGGGGGGGEDYGSLQYDYYEEGPEDGGDGGGGGVGDNDVDIYGDADEGMGMEVDAGQQPGQQEAQPSGQHAQQSGGGLKGGRHPGNLALRGGGGGDGGSPSRDDDRWGADQDASPRHDQQGKPALVAFHSRQPVPQPCLRWQTARCDTRIVCSPWWCKQWPGTDLSCTTHHSLGGSLWCRAHARFAPVAGDVRERMQMHLAALSCSQMSARHLSTRSQMRY